MPVLKAVNLVKVYQTGEVKTIALKGVSLEVEAGEFVAIVGPSGSGKTTLLNILGTLDKPTSGLVYIDGIEVSRLPERKLIPIRRHKIGFVFQFHHLIPVLTAIENVELPMMIAKKPKKERLERAKKLLEIVGLKGKEYRYPHQLSGGEQQRVAIARALANNPKIVIADEPTGNLDSVNSERIAELFRSLKEEFKTAFVVSTHDPIVYEKADRRVYIRDGKIIKED